MAKRKTVAWKIILENTSCIVFATTAAKAKWIAVRSYREAGYGQEGIWPSIRVKRAPQYDKFPYKMYRRAWIEEYVYPLCR